MLLLLAYIVLAHPRLGGASRLEWSLMLLGGVASGIVTMPVFVAFLVGRRAPGRRVPGPPRVGVLAVAVGVLDLLGFAAFTRGTEVGLASIVTAASATFPLIPVAGGVLLMGERPV